MTAKLLGHVTGGKPGMARNSQGLVSGTKVLTADGILPIEHLTIGDRVVTRDGLRVLVDIGLETVVGDVIRISASSLGHARPDDDVLLGVDTTLLIRDWRAKALYGTAQAMVGVARMVDGELIRREKARGLRMYTLEFAAPVVIYAGGLEVACMAAVGVTAL